MAWIYRQSTGEMFHNDNLIGVGYSGSTVGKNDPDKQNLKDVGPIPRGVYTLDPAYHDEHRGDVTMSLHPDRGNEMYGRGGFLIHGDSISSPGTASTGCIILSLPFRNLLARSSDRVLVVVS